MELLCERWQKLALVVLAEPLLELGAGELARRLDHRSLGVDPFGLDRVEPRASARQPADQKAATMAGPLDLSLRWVVNGLEFGRTFRSLRDVQIRRVPTSRAVPGGSADGEDRLGC